MATDTATLSPLELAGRLDAAGLVLGALEDHPAFEAYKEALSTLVGACWVARSKIEEEHKLNGMEVEKLGQQVLDQLDYKDIETRGLDAATVRLNEQVLELARCLYGEGAEWDPANRTWDRGV